MKIPFKLPFKLKISPFQKNLLKAFGVLILVLIIPLTLAAVKQRQEIRKMALEANKAHFSLRPASATLVVNETIISRVRLNTGDNGAVIVTSVTKFNKNHLKVQKISTTDVFANDMSVTPIQEANDSGKITIIQGLSAQQRDPVVGVHKIAQIEFKAIAKTGSLSADNVWFNTNLSKVANSQGGWMKVTAQGARYQVGEEATPTPTPTATPTPTPDQIMGDFNGDGEVDLLDFEIFRNIYIENL